MKRIKTFIGALVLLMLFGCATGQERAEQKARMRQTVMNAVASRQLHIDVIRMNTLRYGTKTISSDFFLELRGDKLHSYLPYMGQAYQSSMATPSVGLNFEAPVLRYSESRPKANKTCIELDVKTEEDTYHYLIDLYDTGDASIHVRSLNRDPVGFDGTLAPL